jgi:hypothetical protein
MGRVTYLHHYVCLSSLFPSHFYSFPRLCFTLSPTHRLALPCSRTTLALSCSANKQLPTLWFAVLMAGHVLNHLIFDSQRLSPGARFIWFVIWTGSVIINFWWFKDFALGIYGPVNDHKGWLWRGSWNVSQRHLARCEDGTDVIGLQYMSDPFRCWEKEKRMMMNHRYQPGSYRTLDRQFQ